MEHRIIVTVERCLGCRSCELACAVEHSASRDLVGAMAEVPAVRSRVRVLGTVEFAAPIQCHQCPDAPCVAICPTGALRRTDPTDPVTVEQDRCVGCEWCTLICPSGVIRTDGLRAIKCDQCVARVAAGELPACVEACPTGALRFEVVREAG